MTEIQDKYSTPNKRFAFRANYRCLDFANTVVWRGTDDPKESLMVYGDLLLWCVYAGCLEADEARDLENLAQRDLKSAQQVLERARELRESLYRVCLAVHENEPVADKDVQCLNDHLAPALSQQRLIRTKSGFTTTWSDAADLSRPVWPIVQSAFELLTSDDLNRVHRCGDATCGWLFFDTSRNHSRRWCEMKDCGNRAKARRFYARTRKEART